MSLRPSNLPMLAACPCFEPEQSDFTTDGTQRHRIFAELLGVAPGTEVDTAALPDEDAEAVRWAAEYVGMLRNPDHGFDSEHRLSLLDDDFNEVMSGTPDVVCGPVIYDLKWRERDYDAQMAAYALMLLRVQRFDEIEVHLLFGLRRTVQKLRFTLESAEAVVLPIVERYRDPNKKPTPCDYCGWCSNRLKCKAMFDRVNAVALGREDWEPAQYHASQATDPAEMAKLLTVARLLVKWAKAVEHHAKVMAGHTAIPGFELTTKAGRKYVADVAVAFQLLGLPQEQFLQACDLRLDTSKKYPDKQGAAELYAALNGMKKTPAKRMVLARLKEVLKTTNETTVLKAVKCAEDEEDQD